MVNKHKQKQDCIPVGCVPPTRHHTGGLPGQRPPCGQTPVKQKCIPVGCIPSAFMVISGDVCLWSRECLSKVPGGIHPPGQTPPAQCMLGYILPVQCMLGYTPSPVNRMTDRHV